MRLLKPKFEDRPLGDSELIEEITSKQVHKLQEEVLEQEKLLEKRKEELLKRTSDLEASRTEIQVAVDYLKNARKEFEKAGKDFNDFIQSGKNFLKTETKRIIGETEAKIVKIEETRAKAQQPLLQEQKALQLFLSEIKEERKGQEEWFEEMERQATQIRKSINEFDEYSKLANQVAERLEIRQQEAETAEKRAESSIQKLREIKNEILGITQRTETQFNNLQKMVEFNNIKLASAEKFAEKIEERFKRWEARLKDREETLQAAFQEAREKGIY